MRARLRGWGILGAIVGGLWGLGFWLLPPVAAQTDRVTFEQVTFTATSTAFTATTLRPTGEYRMQQCTGKLETAEIRLRFDGTAPTASVGMLVDIGDVLVVTGYEHLLRFRGIRTTGTSGVIHFQCTREASGSIAGVLIVPGPGA